MDRMEELIATQRIAIERGDKLLAVANRCLTEIAEHTGGSASRGLDLARDIMKLLND